MFNILNKVNISLERLIFHSSTWFTLTAEELLAMTIGTYYQGTSIWKITLNKVERDI